jgi:hypothetical protein
LIDHAAVSIIEESPIGRGRVAVDKNVKREKGEPMEIIGGRRFIELPGSETHELPPLLVRSAPKKRLDKVMTMAQDIVETEDLIDDFALGDPIAPHEEHDRRKMDLALNLVDQYFAFMAHWQWGDSILEWIRQCETTFDLSRDLRAVLRADVWPHAGRSSFVTLLSDKAVKADGVELRRAVGMRLTFRQPPPIGCFSNQFLFYLNHNVADSAYGTWAAMSPDPISSLPPERFNFQVVSM